MQGIFQSKLYRISAIAFACIIIYIVNGISGYPSSEMSMASSIGQMILFVVFYYEVTLSKITKDSLSA